MLNFPMLERFLVIFNHANQRRSVITIRLHIDVKYEKKKTKKKIHANRLTKKSDELKAESSDFTHHELSVTN